MDHNNINEADLVERYLMGRLAAEESAEFEAHFVDCHECVGKLNTTKALMDGLRVVASDQATKPRRYDPRKISRSPLPMSSRRLLALAAGVLVLVALIGALLVSNQIRRWRVEADQARSASAELERRYEEERQSSSLAEMKRQDSERDLTTQLAQLRAELEKERKQNTEKMAYDHGALKKPQANFAVFQLKSTRGGGPGALNELIVPRAFANFAVSVPLEVEGSHKTYRTTIRDNSGRRIWTDSSSKPDRYNSISIEFNSTFFRNGDYFLIVEGVDENGKASAIGNYPFRIVKKP